MSVKLLTKHNLVFRSLNGDCTGLSESIYVKNATLLDISCPGSCMKCHILCMNEYKVTMSLYECRFGKLVSCQSCSQEFHKLYVMCHILSEQVRRHNVIV